MSIRVDQLSTEVVAEPEPRPIAREEGQTWEALERMRALRSRLERDRRRTHAAGYDD